MAKASYKLPRVFVGCPYGGEFQFEVYRNTLNKIPFRWYYADTHLATKHLIGILTSYIKTVDYCIFDISLWNPNVALEIGLAEGLRVDYYILLNKRLSRGVPADIQGLQRIEYESNTSFDNNGLLTNITRYLVKPLTHPRNIYDLLPTDNKEMCFYFAMGVIAHLRDNKHFTGSDSAKLSRGTYLRKETKESILEMLQSHGYISNITSTKGAILSKNLFPEPLILK